MLNKNELKRRLDAARTLRGMTQAELAARLHEDGFGKQDLGRIERGDMPLQRMRRVIIAGHLGVPEAWFTDPDLDKLVGREPDSGEIRSLLDAISDRLAALELRLTASGLAAAARQDEEPPEDGALRAGQRP